MTIKKDEIYYYITKKVIIKLKALRDDESYTLLPFKILGYIRGSSRDAGHGYALQVGSEISSNQLNYVASEGANKLIFKNGTESIRGVFENEIL